jgi:hypothetical protein
VLGAEVQVTQSVVRDTQPASDGTFGRGMDLEDHREELIRSAVTLERVLVERNHEAGVFIVGSDATVRDSVIQNTLPRAQNMGNGRGLDIEDNGITLERSVVTVERTVVRGSYGVGLIVVGSDATVRDVVVEDVLVPPSQDAYGDGISVELAADTSAPAHLDLQDAVVRRTARMGVLVYDAQASLAGLSVRDVTGLPDGTYGDGVSLAAFQAAPEPSVLLDSTIANTVRAGVATFGDAAATVKGTAIDCSAFALTTNGPTGGLVDGGGNTCGCGDAEEICKIVGAMLTPPSPISE